MKLLVATTNEGKIAEIRALVNSLAVEIVGLDELTIPVKEVVEDGETFFDNAVKKAREYGEQTGMFTLADDSGLEVDALEGRPGVYSKRYGKTDEARIEKLLKEMEGMQEKERTAHFIAVVAVYDPEDKRVYTSTGRTEGIITTTPRGENGFGYDPVFYSLELQKGFGEAIQEEKNRVSHRGKALAALLPILSQLFEEKVS